MGKKGKKLCPSIKVKGGANRVMYDRDTHKKRAAGSKQQRGNLEMRHETDAFQDRMTGSWRGEGRGLKRAGSNN